MKVIVCLCFDDKSTSQLYSDCRESKYKLSKPSTSISCLHKVLDGCKYKFLELLIESCFFLYDRD